MKSKNSLILSAINLFIYGIFFIFTILLPFYSSNGYYTIGSDKALVIYKAVQYYAPIGLGLLCVYFASIFLSEKEAHPSLKQGLKALKSSPLGISVIIYVITLLISFLISDFKAQALFGEDEWYFGLLVQLAGLLFIYMTARFWTSNMASLNVIIASADLILLMGIFNRFNIYAFGMDYVDNGHISTIGNHNWFLGYALLITFLPIYLYLRNDYYYKSSKSKLYADIFYYVSGLIGVIAILINGSDSGSISLIIVLLFILKGLADGEIDLNRLLQLCIGISSIGTLIYISHGLFGLNTNYNASIITISFYTPLMPIILVLSLVLYFFRKKNKATSSKKESNRWSEIIYRIFAILLALGFLLSIVLMIINTRMTNNGQALVSSSFWYFSEAWGNGRGATFLVGIKTFAGQDLLHKLFGVGPDCMWSYISSGQNAELLQYTEDFFGGARLTNAHSLIVTSLVNNGILGTLSFIAMIFMTIRLLFKAQSPISRACGLCLLAFFVNSIISFIQPLAFGMIVVIAGIGLNNSNK